MAAQQAPTDAELLKAQANLWRHSLYYITSMGLQCVIKLGIPTAIHRAGGAATLPDIVTDLSIPPSKLPFLRRLMRLLVYSGVFATSNTDTYRLTPISCLLVDGVVEGHPNQGSVVLAMGARHNVEAAMGWAEWFREDHPSVSPPPSLFEHVHDATPFDETMESLDRDSHALLNEGLAAHDNSGFATVLRECGEVFRGVKSLTDVRGGDGAAARAVAEAFPGVKCTVLDIPRVIGEKKTDGVVNYVAGDIFGFIPPSQAVMLKLVLHHWSDEECVNILAQCKKAIPTREAGGKLIIIDILLGADPGPLLEAELLMDLGMMLISKGRQRDENEWCGIFKKAGFSNYKIVKKLGARGVFEVYP
uniref:O-methyltransferase domain-containing protein n=1 Tax=Leersia perrieri TaxID=77586 RepID=A0A0D9XRC5_9ORYZ